MPLVRISLREGKPAAYRKAVGDAVHQAMVEAINVPPLDRFQVITEHKPDGLIYDAEYLGIRRTDEVVFIQITLNAGRTLELTPGQYCRWCPRAAVCPASAFPPDVGATGPEEVSSIG